MFHMFRMLILFIFIIMIACDDGDVSEYNSAALSVLTLTPCDGSVRTVTNKDYQQGSESQSYVIGETKCIYDEYNRPFIEQAIDYLQGEPSQDYLVGEKRFIWNDGMVRVEIYDYLISRGEEPIQVYEIDLAN